MSDTTSRTLDLLSLLQSHRHWSCRELAERLSVSERTLRRDIDRLRELGYEIDATRGAIGGYRLTAGNGLPPLLLTDDEGVAIAIGLRSQTISGLRDAEHTTLSALAKIEQVLPPALRRRIDALQSHMSVSPGQGPTVDPELLGLLALSSRDSERIRFGYTDARGAVSMRSAEPHMLVPRGRRWYLVAWDRDKAAWRTFRLDRISALQQTRVLFTARDLSAAAAAELVAEAVSWRENPLSVEVQITAPLDDVQAALGWWAKDAVAHDAHTTIWTLAGDSPAHIATALLWLPAELDFTVRGPAGLLDELASFATRFQRLSAASSRADDGR